MARRKLHEIDPYNRGVLATNNGECEIAWYTIQQAPTQWVAVGQIVSAPFGIAKLGTLITASERDEISALKSLEQRCPVHGEHHMATGDAI